MPCFQVVRQRVPTHGSRRGFRFIAWSDVAGWMGEAPTLKKLQSHMDQVWHLAYLIRRPDLDGTHLRTLYSSDRAIHGAPVSCDVCGGSGGTGPRGCKRCEGTGRGVVA